MLNYKPVLHQSTGIGVYANAVLPALQQFEHVLLPGGGAGGGKERLKRLAWTQIQLPSLATKLKADLIFTPAPEGYLGTQVVPQVVMVHDLRPLIHPERSLQSVYFRSWVPKLLRTCHHILTNSRYSASEILHATGVDPERISVTPLGYDVNHFTSKYADHKPHSRPYFLHVGQAYPHKNIRRIILAFKRIASLFPEVDLILLGKPHPTETKILKHLAAESGLIDRVIFKSYVLYQDLPTWYRGAIAFVYPSLWEGFGLPILEAMACGCPVITSYGTGMEEVSSGHSFLVDPLDVLAITSRFLEVLESSQEERLKRINKGIQHASRFSWHQTRNQTSEIITRFV